MGLICINCTLSNNTYMQLINSLLWVRFELNSIINMLFISFILDMELIRNLYQSHIFNRLQTVFKQFARSLKIYLLYFRIFHYIIFFSNSYRIRS